MARRKRFKSPTARLWQVWCYSALKDGTYWLEYASPVFEKALLRHLALRVDYQMSELRTPLGDVYDSHDAARCPSAEGREELLWRFDVQAVPEVSK